MNGSCLDPDVKDPINAAPTCKGANKTNNAKPFPYVPGHYDAVQRTDKKKAMMIARRIQERQISISHLASVHQNKKQNIRYIILREKKRKSMMVMVEIGPLSIL